MRAINNITQAIGRLGINAGRRSSWSSYWTHLTDLFLFFGQVKNISDGKLYNEMAGSTDYLTVGGMEGIYTFQCPDTADYLAADVDRIWFKTGFNTRRTVTEAELVGNDLQRTPVKYDNVDPYLIRWIAILKDGVALTDLQRNNLFKSFELSVWWDNAANFTYGFIKGNRVVQELYNPLGDEILINGGFDDDGAGWSILTSWEFAGGKAVYLDLADSRISRTMVITNGVTYRLTFDISNTVGGRFSILNQSSAGIGLPSTNLYTITHTNGSYIYYFTSISTTTGIRILGYTAGETFSIDNLSIKEVL